MEKELTYHERLQINKPFYSEPEKELIEHLLFVEFHRPERIRGVDMNKCINVISLWNKLELDANKLNELISDYENHFETKFIKPL